MAKFLFIFAFYTFLWVDQNNSSKRTQKIIYLKSERKGSIYRLKYEFLVNHFDFTCFKVKFINLILGAFL